MSYQTKDTRNEEQDKSQVTATSRQQLVDNRVATVTQRKQLSVMESSSRLAAQQRLGNAMAESPMQKKKQLNVNSAAVAMEPVRQLAPVTKAKLNVIGEDHSESEPRIEKEKTYLANAAGGEGYWDETTFKIGELNRGWGRLIDRRQKGDPSWLHMEYLMSGLVKNLDINRKKVARGDKFSAQDHQDEHLWPWDSWTIFIDGVGTYIQTRFYDLSEAQVTLLRESLDKSAIAREKMTALTAAVESGNDLVARFDEAHSAVEAFATKLYGAIRQMDVINDDRELNMHNAANAGSALKGAWKIGEEHVQSLLDPSKSPRFDDKKYNVTTRDEFNQELPK